MQMMVRWTSTAKDQSTYMARLARESQNDPNGQPGVMGWMKDNEEFQLDPSLRTALLSVQIEMIDKGLSDDDFSYPSPIKSPLMALKSRSKTLSRQMRRSRENGQGIRLTNRSIQRYVTNLVNREDAILLRGVGL